MAVVSEFWGFCLFCFVFCFFALSYFWPPTRGGGGDLQPSPPPFKVAGDSGPAQPFSHPRHQPSELRGVATHLCVVRNGSLLSSEHRGPHLCPSFPGESVLVVSKRPEEHPVGATARTCGLGGCSGGAGVSCACVWLCLRYTTQVASATLYFFSLGNTGNTFRISCGLLAWI